MATNRQIAAAKLLKSKLLRFGVSEAQANELVSTGKLCMHRQRGETSEFYTLHLQPGWTFLGLAEHAARCIANWSRPYHVDTTRLAMAARA